MSEEQDKPVEETPQDGSEVPSGGARLAAARREKQISVLEIAKELHLDEPKVRALERDEYDVLGAPVFAKGHLRKYAQLVGVDADDVLADYYQLTRSQGMPPVVVGRRKVSREISPGPWIAAIIVVLVSALAYWWFAIRQVDIAPAPPPAQQQQQEQDSDSSVVDDPAVQTAAETTGQAEETEDQQDVDASSAVATPEPIVEPPPEGEFRLTLTFSGDCWTEIFDADGRRLFFEMGRNGQIAELQGRAPLSALFGNVDNVQLLVNGSDYAIPTTNARSRTVRLTIVNP